MSAKRVFQIVLVVSVVLLAVGVGAGPAGTVRALRVAQQPGTEGATIPYSGRLTDDAGQPVADGAYHFTFALYEAAEGGTPLWSETQTGVAVRGGDFSALLGSVSPLPAAAEGRGLWLAVGVRGPGEVGFTLLSPRQALSAAASVGAASPSAGPACAHDHLGEDWVGAYGTGLAVETTIADGDAIVGVGNNSGTGVLGIGGDRGVDGESIGGLGVVGITWSGTGVEGSSVNGIGLRGYGSIGVEGVGATFGVSGTTQSGGVAGVYGSSTTGIGAVGVGATVGVSGTAASGTGVYGGSTNGTGVNGRSTTGIGVAGIGATYGVSGTAASGIAGVYGFGSGRGVEGYTGGSGVGVYGHSDLGGVGVSGNTNSTAASGVAATVGYNSGSGTGVWGYGGIGVAGLGATYGVSGTARSGGTAGVYGGSTSGRGVYGESTNDVGVWGQSTYNTGVAGKSTNGVGVWGESISGIGVYGFSGNNTGVFVVSFIADPIIAQGGNPAHNVFRVDHTGRGYFNGGHQDGGADVAEFIQASDSVQPGDVVEIDPDHAGQFRLAATANTTAVAGVISTNPGESLGAIDPAGAENSGPQLALAGRVPVKVSAENGAIHPGDLLVASSTPGHAMRAPADPAPGTVIGKALGDLESGTGVIEMLVMLR